jgi:site-specific DNA recombinase
MSLATQQNVTTRAAIYARQSVAEDGKSVGLDDRHKRQVELCRQLAELRGWTVVREFKEIASATSVRGAKSEWAAMLAGVEARDFDVVISLDLDRLLRTTRDLTKLIELHAKVVTVDGEIDLSSADGEFRATMLAGIARFEGRRKAERMVRANKTRRETGVPTAGRVPYGYEWIKTPDRERDELGRAIAYAIDPGKAAFVRQAYQLLLAGETLGAICRTLNEAGSVTNGAPNKGKPGVAWRPSTMRRMLLSPYYAALIPPATSKATGYDQSAIERTDCTEGAWPEIVTPETWQSAQSILLQPARRSNKGGVARKWLLSGLALCGVCGAPVRAGGGEAGIHSYRCPTMAHFMRRGEALDAYVEELVVAKLTDLGSVGAVPSADETADLAELRRERASIVAASDGLLSLIESGRRTADQLVERLDRLDKQLDEIDAKIAQAGKGAALSGLLGVDDVRAAWDALSLARKRAVVAEVLVFTIDTAGQGNRSQSFEKIAATTGVRYLV